MRFGCLCEPVASDARKNDGHKYRSYLCFMTCSGPEPEAAESEAKLQLSTGQILTDVLAHCIRYSSSLLPLPPATHTTSVVSEAVLARDSCDSRQPLLSDLIIFELGC